MQNIFKKLLVSKHYLIFSGIVVICSMQYFGIINVNRVGNIFFVKHNSVFDLVEEKTNDSTCEFPVWGGCFVDDIFYDKEYIEKEKDKFEGSGCRIERIYRFRGIKRGLSKIDVDGSCHFDKTYNILIY